MKTLLVIEEAEESNGEVACAVHLAGEQAPLCQRLLGHPGSHFGRDAEGTIRSWGHSWRHPWGAPARVEAASGDGGWISGR